MLLDVFNIQHFSTGDGPGIRSTIFFGGCNLCCPWCHNPESFITGSNMRHIDEIVDDVMSDKEFYAESGGGVTLSGGEPLIPGNGCLELLRRLKEKELHIIIDTALSADNIDLPAVASYTDMFFVDIKTADSGLFSSVCGGDMDLLCRNIDKLTGSGADIVFRIPLIPGFNMDDISVDKLIAFTKGYSLPVTLLPFHRLGSAKYKELGLTYKYADIEPPSDREADAIRMKFNNEGIMEANV